MKLPEARLPEAEALYLSLLGQIRAAYDVVPQPTADSQAAAKLPPSSETTPGIGTASLSPFAGQNGGSAAVVIAGILSGGAWLAERLALDLGASGFGVINVALHRDDYAKKGLHIQAGPTSLPFNVDGRHILLVDDVLFTGRTVRAALNELYDYGRPARVDLAVLVDRGGRELPFAARFAAASLELAPTQNLVLSRDPQTGLMLSTEAREL